MMTMGRLLLSLCILCFSMISSSGTKELINEQIRVDSLGPCLGDCHEFCVSKHADGLGVCENGSCKCSYRAEPQKRCRSGLFRCTLACNTPCCNIDCASVYHNGSGYCDDSLGPDNAICMCDYDC